MRSPWIQTHVVTVGRATFPVMHYEDGDDGASLYSRQEWDAAVPAYWTLDDGVLFGAGRIVDGAGYQKLAAL